MYQTNHQREILSLFKNHPEQGYTGVEIVHLFKETINKATIYRKLSSDCENHLHLICKQCGKITHLVCEETNGFIAHISLQHAFEVDKLSTTIFGLCQECKTYA